MLSPSFYRRPAEAVARDLLGRYVVRQTDAWRGVLRIVETEAYLGAEDRASHAWGERRTRRNESLYLPSGHAYVYFIYGIHHCLNAVTNHGESGAAVLIRAGEVIDGEKRMFERRRLRRPPKKGDLAGGPGKICQALGIDLRQDGISLDSEELHITIGEPPRSDEISHGPRIGVAYAKEAALWPLRFAIRGHGDVSRPRLR